MPRDRWRLVWPTVIAATLISAVAPPPRADERAGEVPPVAAESRQTAKRDPLLDNRDQWCEESEKLAAEGKHAEALAAAEKAMAIEVALFGGQSEDVAGSWDWIGQQQLALDQFSEAIAAYEREASIWSAVKGAPAWRVADARRKVADAQKIQGLSHHQRAELKRAMALNAMGLQLQERGAVQDALAKLTQALALRKSILGEQHHDTAESLNNVGVVFDILGDYSTARPYYEQSLAINRKVLGENHPGTAGSLNNLGFLLEETGDYSTARTYYEQALAIKRKALGEEHADTAISLNNLGSLLQSTGDYSAARIYYQQALTVRRKIFGEMHPVTAGSLNNLGLLLLAMGDYSAARPNLEQALAINRQVLGEGHRDTGTSHNNLGLFFNEMGDNSAARSHFEQALAIYLKNLGEEHPDTAAALGNLGLLLKSMQEYAAARPYLDKALAINRKVFGEEHPETARSINSLGTLLEAKGDDDARPYYEQALAINRKTLGDGHPQTATSLNNVGLLLASQGEYEAARPYCEQALAIRRNVFGEDHPDTAQSQINLGLLLAAVGQQAVAAEQFVAAAVIRQRLLDRELFTLSEAKMQLLLDQSLGGLDVLASLPLADLNRSADAATLLLSRKAITFEVLNRRRAAEFLAASDPAVAHQRSQLLVAQKKLDDLAMHPPKDVATVDLAARRHALRKECESFEDQLSRALAVFLGTNVSLTVSLDAVFDKLSDEAAHVEFFLYRPFNFRATGTQPGWGKPRYAAFVLRAATQRQITFIDLGPATAIDALVGELAGQVKEFNRFGRREGGEALAEEAYREVAADLNAKLIAPLEASLSGAKQVHIGPDSRLHEIPFEALVDSSGKYLVETGYHFAYVNSGRDLVRERTDQLGSGVFVFAGPNYNETGASRLAVAERLAPGKSRSHLVGSAKPRTPDGLGVAARLAAYDAPISRSADTRLGWRHLPGADLEGKEAGAAFASGQWGDVFTYTGNEALEDLVKQVAKPRALVFVTHGDFLEDQPAFLPGDASGARSSSTLDLDRGGAGQARAGLRATEDPMLRSYLLLAGANRIDEPLPLQQPLDNGWLTAREIAQLDLRGTDLVVLSACNTSRGKAGNGQAVTGMRSAFLFAGARTIVGSLYEVPNAETRELLKPFYEGVAAGGGKLASLNAAKLDFIHRRRQQANAAHPFYWASFVLVGEP